MLALKLGELPTNMLLITGLASITVLWGIVMTCMGLVQTKGELIACRVLLGVTESGE